MDSARSGGTRRIDLAGLREALGEFEVRDEDLVLEPAPRIGVEAGVPRTACYAGVDGEQRAILAVTAAGDEAVLLAIDALAWCDAHGDLLARRIGADVEFGTSVALVLAEPTEATLSALAALRTGDLRIFLARNLRSARSESGDLVEVERRSNSGSTSPGPIWDAELDVESRGLVERVLSGLPRIDPDARTVAAPRSIVWRRGQVALIQLRCAGGRLEAEVDGERYVVADDRGVEQVLAGALRGYLALDADSMGARERTLAPAGKPLMPRGPLLSEDELAALRGEG